MLSRLDLVAWVLAVAAGAVLLLSGRAPRLGSSLGWVYPAMVTACSVAVLILELFWWVTGADPVVSVVAGVAGLWLFFAARVRVRVLQRRREDLVARARERDPRCAGL
jgi:uncharacterized membrane protein